ncbi:MAG: PAS domain-containing protein [Pseudomonadota bacterium]
MEERVNPRSGLPEDAAAVVSSVGGSGVAMVISDPSREDNPIIYVNKAFEEVTGYSRSAAEGRNCRFLQGEDTDLADVRKLKAGIEAREEVVVDILNYRADGEPFMNRLLVSPVLNDEGDVVLFLGVQQRLSDDVLDSGSGLSRQLTEIQHRVKNHLSMIIGMIRLQARETENKSDFAALARRIESLQMLYEEMSGANRAAQNDSIALGSYLTRVANAIAHIDGRSGIRTNIDVARVRAPLDAATRLGLILSEIMTNCFQHAFVGLDSGLVEVRLAEFAEGGVRLTVADDGVGIPAETEWPSRGSLGGQLLIGLVDGLSGTIQVTRGAAGTVVTVEVPAGNWNEDGSEIAAEKE